MTVAATEALQRKIKWVSETSGLDIVTCETMLREGWTFETYRDKPSMWIHPSAKAEVPILPFRERPTPDEVLNFATFDGEIRTVSSTGGEKGAKPQRFSLLPVEALEKVAELYGKGAAKYAAHNWRRGYDWSKSYDAMMRHANAFWRGEDIDEEMQSPHLAAVAFHALTLLTFMEEQPSFDDRYKKETADDEENNSNTAKWVGEVPPSGSYGGNLAGRFPGGRLDGQA